MSAPSPEEERWIERLAAGADTDEDVLEARLAEATDPATREDLRGLIAARDALRRVARAESEIRAGAEEPPAEDDRRQVEAWAARELPHPGAAPIRALAPAAGAPARTRRGRRRGELVLLVAALAAALLFLLLRPREQPAGRGRDVRLGAGGLTALAPEGPTEGLGTFRWRVDLPVGGRVELSFFTDEDGRPGERIAGPFRLGDVREWTPPADLAVRELERWHWEVDAYAPTGELLGTASALVTTSPPGSASSSRSDPRR